MEAFVIKLNNEKFLCHTMLGRGEFSIAYKATRQSDGLEVILKKFDPRHKKDPAQFYADYKTHVDLLNTTVNTAGLVMGLYHDNAGTPWIISPSMQGETLKDTRFANLHQLFTAFRYIVAGLGQFHKAGYLMLDLNPSNVFLLSNGGSMEGCYFFDFDAFVAKENLADVAWIHSSRGFAAPEVMKSEPARLSEAADIYALGATLFYCLTGSVPASYNYVYFDPDNLLPAFQERCSKQVLEKLKALFYNILHPIANERTKNWADVYDAITKLEELTDPKALRLLSNTFLDVGENYVPTPVQLDALKNFYIPQLGQKAYAVIYSNISGSGKTTLAKAFAKEVNEHYDSIQFCHYDPTKGWNGILSQIELQSAEKGPAYTSTVETALRSGLQRTLVIIDNFDQEACHEKLPNWGNETHILFTSRFQADALKELSPCLWIDMECGQGLSEKIFTKVYCDLSGTTLSDTQKAIAFRLLADIDYHTYATTLIARELAQHYPTDDGFKNFSENTHRLWESTIASRKDLHVGEATVREKYRVYIDLLFADQLSRFQSPVEETVLCLLSTERVWSKDLLLLLAGDDPKAGRFLAQDAVAKLKDRNLATVTDTEISIHPLVHQLLAQDEKFIHEKFLWLFLENYYARFREQSSNLIPYWRWPDALCFEYGFSSRGIPNEYNSYEGLMLMHSINSTPAKWFFTKKGFFDKIPHKQTKKMLANLFKKKQPYVNIILGSLQDRNRKIYFVHTPQTKETFPLVALSTRYLDEENNLAVSIEEYERSKGTVCIERAIWHEPDMILPTKIDGKLVCDLCAVRWHDVEGNHSIQLPGGLKKIHSDAFFVSTIETIHLPQTLETIDSNAFFGCNNLKELRLPGNLETLKPFAFSHCQCLEKLTVTNPMMKAHELAFIGCPKLRIVDAPAEWKKAHSAALSLLPACDPTAK